MKIILSRKGFDSGNAGMPSPVMPDGKPLSLPIPRYRGQGCSYEELYSRGQSLSDIISDLSNGTKVFPPIAHVDPDLEEERLPRKPGWRPIFGQTGGDQTHLENQGVGVGDLFLFFGWFRCTEISLDGRLRFIDQRDGFHAIFGWLQIGEIHRVNKTSVQSLAEWTKDHPHIATANSFDSNNTVYISTEELCIGGVNLGFPGGGAFQHLTSDLRLSAAVKRRSRWALPLWFFPKDIKHALSYHRKLSSWSIQDGKTILNSVAKGQEFVLDTSYYPEAIPWVVSLFREEAKNYKKMRY